VPTLLYTFLGRVSSRHGREFERVLAVRVARGGTPEFLGSPSDWTNLAGPRRAVRTTGLWEAHFEGWAGPAEAKAITAAQEGFRPLAEAFLKERRATLEKEKAGQQEWLARRAEDITGPIPKETARQAGLFDATPEESAAESSIPEWASLRDAVQRLAAFHSDRSQRPSPRSEAEGVLRIYRQRVEVLDRLLDLKPSEVIPLGVLMLIPEAAHGV
jgi:hypothetical protein